MIREKKPRKPIVIKNDRMGQGVGCWERSGDRADVWTRCPDPEVIYTEARGWFGLGSAGENLQSERFQDQTLRHFKECLRRLRT